LGLDMANERSPESQVRGKDAENGGPCYPKPPK